MKEMKKWVLTLFGEAPTGEEIPSADTPQTTDAEAPAGDTEGAPDAGERTNAKTRQEEFRALMEGTYKDLFTAYFQETFNRRFKEQKTMREEYERTRAVAEAAAERYGVRDYGELIAAIRAEQVRETAPTDVAAPSDPEERGEPDGETAAPRETEAQRTAEAVAEAVRAARAETMREVTDHIRARGLRPVEIALSAGVSQSAVPVRLSRAQRAEVARRAARGEYIEL